MDSRYRTAINRDTAPAAAGEFAPLAIGPLRVWPPVALAPMAGVTNPPFRALCRRFGAGLYVSEMVTSRALLERNARTLERASFAPGETPRSIQLYGIDPRDVGEAISLLVGEERVDHVDLNFGCPARKVTRRGGGAAIPAKPNLLRRLVRAAVSSAGAVPVSIKLRIGIDDRHSTFLTAGRIAEEEGCAAVALHARTAAQLYDGRARWEAIGELKRAVKTIPVLGNGDIFEPYDALRMMRETGCDGVVVGRGCLGRPWLFRDLARVFEGHEAEDPPRFGQVVDIMLEHARLLAHWLPEPRVMGLFRKHSSWYTKGFVGSTRLRERLVRVTRLRELEEALRETDRNEPFPPHALRIPRGKSGGTQRVVLPEGYLDDPADDTPPCPQAEDPVSGG